MVAPRHKRDRKASKHEANVVNECQRRMLLGVASIMLGGALAVGAPNLAFADDFESEVDSAANSDQEETLVVEPAEPEGAGEGLLNQVDAPAAEAPAVEEELIADEATVVQDGSSNQVELDSSTESSVSDDFVSDEEPFIQDEPVVGEDASNASVQEGVADEEESSAQGEPASQASVSKQASESPAALDASAEKFNYEGNLDPDQAIDVMQKLLDGIEDGSTETIVELYSLEDLKKASGDSDPLNYLIQVLTGYDPKNDYSSVGAGNLPRAYSLRTDGDVGTIGSSGGVNVVTVVKNQAPFGSCWSFAIVSASEVSVLAEAYAKWSLLGPEMKRLYGFETFQEFAKKVDFSERHLAWFVRTPISNEDSDQYGEGSIPIGDSEDPNARLNTGGAAFFGTSLFSSGIGPVFENDAPYSSDEYSNGDPAALLAKNNNDYEVSMPEVGVWLVREGKRGTIDAGKLNFPVFYDSDGVRYEVSQISFPSRDDTKEITFVAVKNSDGDEFEFDSDVFKRRYFHWGLEEESRFQTAFELEESFVFVGNSIEAIKRELLAGRAVSVGFCADQSMPGKEPSSYTYLNPQDNAWAQYTYDNVEMNHVVTIVGYNDDFPVEYFIVQPPAPGAWLVKNSWGGGRSEGLNSGNWGIDENGDGIGDGYFWLSYFDKSITLPESFNFKVEDLISERPEFQLDQYDLLPVHLGSYLDFSDSEELCSGNVFHVDQAVNIREIGVTTTRLNETVSYQVFLLPSDYQDPASGKLIASGNGILFENLGYHRIALDDVCIIPADSFYSVIITMKGENGKYYAPLATGESKELSIKSGSGTYSSSIVNKGESFLFRASEGWSDLTDAMADWLFNVLPSTVDVVDNFPIKAYADYLVGDIGAFAPQFDPSKGIDLGVTDQADAEHKAAITLQGVFDEIMSGVSSDESEKVREGVVSGETYDALREASADFYNNPFFTIFTNIKKVDPIQSIAGSIGEAGMKMAFCFSIDSAIKRHDPNEDPIDAEEVVFGNLLKFDNPISFSIAIPDDLMAEGRKFFIFGPAGQIDAMVVNGVAIFLTDIATGDFALAYEDGNQPGPNPDPGPTPDPTPDPDPGPTPDPDPAPEPDPDPDSDSSPDYWSVDDSIEASSKAASWRSADASDSPETGDATSGAAVALSVALLSAGMASLARRKRQSE